MLRRTLEIVRQFVLRLIQPYRDRRRPPASQTAARSPAASSGCPESRAPSDGRPSHGRSLSASQLRASAHFQRHAFLIQLNLQLDDELVHHLMDHLGRQVIEPDNVVQTVTELRREDLLDLSIASVLLSRWIRPMDLRSVSRTPALVVITNTTLRKSALRPLLSVSVPLSITCSRMLNTSGALSRFHRAAGPRADA